jgi:peptidoglycan/xylan/chitin deacetylase (PgdA/CDA1 family)
MLAVTRIMLIVAQAIWAGHALAGEIAITIDDLPYVQPSRTTPKEGVAQAKAIVAALERHDITATGFVTGNQVNWRSRRALRVFSDAGHTLGNHSWSHPDYGGLTVDQFREETERTDRLMSKWRGAAKLYRFPYLREGSSEARRAVAAQVLQQLGYENVPVTIDNDDWLYNDRYLDALEAQDLAAAQTVAQEYIAHMQAQTLHFEALARKATGREVKHVLLLHLNQINADHLGTLLEWYATEGWTFVTVQEALSDPIYRAAHRYNGVKGLSQIERVLGGPSQ